LEISEEKLSLLPENEEITGLQTIETEQMVDVSAKENAMIQSQNTQIR